MKAALAPNCVKCGSGFIETRYATSKHIVGHLYAQEPCEPYLHRTCECGYSWSELPLDAPGRSTGYAG